VPIIFEESGRRQGSTTIMVTWRINEKAKPALELRDDRSKRAR